MICLVQLLKPILIEKMPYFLFLNVFFQKNCYQGYFYVNNSRLSAYKKERFYLIDCIEFYAKFNILILFKQYSILGIMRNLNQKSIQQSRQEPRIDPNNQKEINNIQNQKHFDSGCSSPNIIPNNVGNNGILIQNNFKNEENYRNFKFLKLILFGITIVQFSLQGGVILIQYISSKITLNLFVVLIIIDCVLIVMILVLFKNTNGITYTENKNKKCENLKEPQIQINSLQHNLPTLPKIKNQQLPRVYEKTKKLKPIQIQFKVNTQTKKCLKNFQTSVPNNQSIQQLYYTKGNGTEFTYVLFVTKILHNLFALICTTVSFITIQNPMIDGGSYMSVLLVVINILVILSFIVLTLLYSKFEKLKKHQENLQNQQSQGRLKIIQEKIGTPKVITIPSIENHLRLKRNEKKKTTISIEKMIKSNSNGQDDCNSNPNIVRIVPESKNQINLQKPVIEEKEDSFSLIKMTKKSVLKNSKLCLAKRDSFPKPQEKDFQPIQRRKVEINSKKIEYFEYSDVSSGKSQLMDKCYKTNNINEKSRFKGQSSRSLKHKMIVDSKLLQRKRQQNQKRQIAKSNKSVPVKKQTDLDLSFRSHFEDYLS